MFGLLLHFFWYRLAKIFESIECVLIDLEHFNLFLDLRFFALLHGYLSFPLVYSIHSLFEFLILLLVSFIFLCKLNSLLIVLPFLLLHTFLVLDCELVNHLNVSDLLHKVFKFNFNVSQNVNSLFGLKFDISIKSLLVNSNNVSS